MIGIYKITNNLDGKIYIGQSVNLKRRIAEHFNANFYNKTEIDKAIEKEGKENFSFEIIEICSKEDLNSREKYWIQYYHSFENGYNCTHGGTNTYCGRPKLTKDDVKQIRIAYAAHKNWNEVYQNYKEKISVDGFKHIWQGNRWKTIMPEVYTEENKKYYSELGRFKPGELNKHSNLSDQDVINIRKRYVNETASTIWNDYKEICTFESFKHILTGVKYSHLPIYKKRQKQWIKNGEKYEFE